MEQMQSNNSLLHREMVYSVTSLFLCTVLQSVLLPDTTQQGYKQVVFLVEVFLCSCSLIQHSRATNNGFPGGGVPVFLLPDTTQQGYKQWFSWWRCYCSLIQHSRATNKWLSWWLCSRSLIQHSRATNKWLSWWRCSCSLIQHSRATNKWLSWWLCSCVPAP